MAPGQDGLRARENATRPGSDRRQTGALVKRCYESAAPECNSNCAARGGESDATFDCFWTTSIIETQREGK